MGKSKSLRPQQLAPAWAATKKKNRGIVQEAVQREARGLQEDVVNGDAFHREGDVNLVQRAVSRMTDPQAAALVAVMYKIVDDKATPADIARQFPKSKYVTEERVQQLFQMGLERLKQTIIQMQSESTGPAIDMSGKPVVEPPPGDLIPFPGQEEPS